MARLEERDTEDRREKGCLDQQTTGEIGRLKERETEEMVRLEERETEDRREEGCLEEQTEEMGRLAERETEEV